MSPHNNPQYLELLALAARWETLALEARQKAQSHRLTGQPPGHWTGVHAGLMAAAGELRLLISIKLDEDVEYASYISGLGVVKNQPEMTS